MGTSLERRANTDHPAHQWLCGVLGDPRNEASLLRGRESASSNRAIGRTGGLGEGAQTRLSEVAKSAACFVLFAHSLVCSSWATWRPSDHGRSCARFQELSERKTDQIPAGTICRKLSESGRSQGRVASARNACR